MIFNLSLIVTMFLKSKDHWYWNSVVAFKGGEEECKSVLPSFLVQRQNMMISAVTIQHVSGKRLKMSHHKNTALPISTTFLFQFCLVCRNLWWVRVITLFWQGTKYLLFFLPENVLTCWNFHTLKNKNKNN